MHFTIGEFYVLTHRCVCFAGLQLDCMMRKVFYFVLIFMQENKVGAESVQTTSQGLFCGLTLV